MLNELDAQRSFENLEQRLRQIAAERSAERLSAHLTLGAWIYGAGNYGQRVARLMKEKNLPVLGFIDQRGATLSEIAGLPVFTPQSFPRERAENRCFVLGVFNEAMDADNILNFAKSLPFAARLWNADIPEVFGPEANSVWLSSRSYLLDHIDALRSVAAALSDQASLDTFSGLLTYRFTGEPSDFPEYNYHTQYMPTDLPGFDRPITFVDGGAFNGDTGAMLHNHGVAISSWIAFEPDVRNFHDLTVTARKLGIPATLFPCGLSDGLHQASFVDNQGLGSHIARGAEPDVITIQCMALDDAVPNLKPDFIKLDIEGAELAALNGMAKLVANNAPRLAICAYHKPQDMWEIPQKMLELTSNAPLYLRQHLINGWETVFYSIPNS